MNALNNAQSLLAKLTQTIYLDRLLKILGVGGFIVTYMNAWRSMGFGLKLGFVFSAAAWFVGARFTKIYR
ncbi:MAG TPA: hypothetical protein VKQ28_03945 [Candidatus Acidoferrum sp.]|nr:hypothetical protein [Candidatus Acidoferrum sp.]